MPAQARFRALSILELHNPCGLNRIFAYTKHPRRDLGDHMVFVFQEWRRVATFTGASESTQSFRRYGSSEHEIEADGTEGHSSPVDRDGDGNLRAGTSTVQIDREITIFVVREAGVGMNVLEVESVEASPRFPYLILK